MRVALEGSGGNFKLRAPGETSFKQSAQLLMQAERAPLQRDERNSIAVYRRAAAAGSSGRRAKTRIRIFHGHVYIYTPASSSPVAAVCCADTVSCVRLLFLPFPSAMEGKFPSFSAGRGV